MSNSGISQIDGKSRELLKAETFSGLENFQFCTPACSALIHTNQDT